MGDYLFVNTLAGDSVINYLVDTLVEKGLLTLPSDGIGAEGMWMLVE